MLPFLTLGGVLGDVGVECFRYAVKRKAVVGGEDEFFFEPEAFLEFFDVGEELDDLGGDAVDEFCGFKTVIATR